MSSPISSIWLQTPADMAAQVRICIDEACDRAANKHPVYIFFRADDVGVPGKRFERLLEIFAKHRAPLCLAIVPAWLTRPRWQALNEVGKNAAYLWCWHQHGWRHANHELSGKKQEFGPARARSALERDIKCGKQRLASLMGKSFYPVFTPPWNRCDHHTLNVLKNLGYCAISRSRGSRPPALKGLPDLFVDVDLHTRKEQDPLAGWENLFNDLKQGITSGRCGIMIHHQRMNAAAFDFLDMLLKTLIQRKELQLIDFKGILEEKVYDQ